MINKITRDELKELVASGEKFKLVNVLNKESYAKEHIKGAISLPLNEIDKKAGKRLRKDEKIVVYCASFDCQASTKAAEKLISLGYQNVLDYKGGLADYKEAGFPLQGRLHEADSFSASACRC